MRERGREKVGGVEGKSRGRFHSKESGGRAGERAAEGAESSQMTLG